MLLQKLLVKNKDNIEEIKILFRKEYPIFEDYEEEHYGTKKIEEVYQKFFCLFDKKFKDMLVAKIERTDNIIFIVKQKESSYEYNFNSDYLHSFSCKRKDILNNMNEEFSLWNDNLPRIEHYVYDYVPFNELLGTDVFFSNDISEIEVICVILHEIFRHGFEEYDRECSLNNLINMLEESVKDIEEENTIDSETFFEQLQNEILEKASEDEKKSILKDRENHKRNKNRDRLFSHLVIRINHKKCISLIEEYLIQEIINGNIIIQ